MPIQELRQTHGKRWPSAPGGRRRAAFSQVARPRPGRRRSPRSPQDPFRVVRSSAETRPPPRRAKRKPMGLRQARARASVARRRARRGDGCSAWRTGGLALLVLVFRGERSCCCSGSSCTCGAFPAVYVDERLDLVERSRAAEQARDALASDGRRAPARAPAASRRPSTGIRDATRPHGTAAQLAVDECLRLLAAYVRLAMAYNVSRECLASVDRRLLGEELRALEGRRLPRKAGHARELAKRRVSRSRKKRAERWGPLPRRARGRSRTNWR